MGRSAASKDQMGLRPDYRKNRQHRAFGQDVSDREEDYRNALNYEMHAEGDSVGKDHYWMQSVSENSKKGALHKAMHIPEGKKISTSALEKETHAKSPLMRKRANLALRYRGK